MLLENGPWRYITPFYRGKKETVIFGHFVGAPFTTPYITMGSKRPRCRRGPIEVHKLPELNAISATKHTSIHGWSKRRPWGFGRWGWWFLGGYWWENFAVFGPNTDTKKGVFYQGLFCCPCFPTKKKCRFCLYFSFAQHWFDMDWMLQRERKST